MISKIYMTLGMSYIGFWVLVSPLFALGTAAGTQVFNTVEVSFRINDDPQTLRVERANDVFTVSEIIRSNVSGLNPEGVAAATPGQDVPLSFQLTNTGNGEEVFRLSPQAGGTGSGDFSADITRLWIESNGEPGWQADDTPYNDVEGISLAADQGAVIYVVSNIPAGLADQARGEVTLTATSATDGASALSTGEAVPADRNDGVEAVVAQDGASTQGNSSYVVSGIRLTVDKDIVLVRDPYQGSRVMPGAAVTYQITVSAEGRGVAKDLRIHDPAPNNMAYQPNTLTVDGQALSDAVDTDSGYFDQDLNTVWFTPGTLTAPLTRVYTVTYIVN